MDFWMNRLGVGYDTRHEFIACNVLLFYKLLTSNINHFHGLKIKGLFTDSLSQKMIDVYLDKQFK